MPLIPMPRNKKAREIPEGERKRALLVLRWREAGVLSKDGEEFMFFKCPFHNTWMQPELEPYPHWACMAKDYCKEKHPMPDKTGADRTRVACMGHACTFKRAAKMRLSIERRIFSIAKFLEKYGD